MIKVLIAEDDFRVAGIHEQFLSKVDNIEVVGKVLNGQETLQFLKKQEVDLLLLDIYLPDISGIDLLPKIRHEVYSIDIIVITAATDSEIVKESMSYGVFDFIIKPLRMERFLETINKYKDRKQFFDAVSEFDQQAVDQILMSSNGFDEKKSDNLPKGIDSLTLEKVKKLTRSETNGVTAEEMGEKMGASRTTARRYLEYLISVGEVKAELEYGIVGRPERIYYII